MIHHSEFPIRNREVKFETPPFSLEEIRNWRGKRLKKENRVFFSFELEAQKEKYRPCGICMKNDYIKWESGLIWSTYRQKIELAGYLIKKKQIYIISNSC